MRNVFYALTALGLLAHQVVSLPGFSTALAAQTAHASDKTNYTLTFNTQKPSALQIDNKSPDFDTEILAPLRAKQDARAAEKALVQAKVTAAKAALIAQTKAAAKIAQAKTIATTQITSVASGDVWERLRLCEAGGNYANKNNPSYRGAYQFSFATWGGYGGFYDPADAPASVQDAKARQTQASSGWGPWPACARKLGLL